MNPDYTDEQIDAALAIVKKEGGYCQTFDNLVKEAKSLSYLMRLDLVASDHGKQSVFQELLTVLKRRDLPEIGRWIEAETVDGWKHTFKVTGHRFNREWGTFFRPSENSQELFITWRPNGDVTRKIVSWKYVEKQWAVGDLVPAGTPVGKEWSGLYEGAIKDIDRASDFRKGAFSTYDRRIVWIEQ